jgi:hypothetical protein
MHFAAGSCVLVRATIAGIPHEYCLFSLRCVLVRDGTGMPKVDPGILLIQFANAAWTFGVRLYGGCVRVFWLKLSLLVANGCEFEGDFWSF